MVLVSRYFNRGQRLLEGTRDEMRFGPNNDNPWRLLSVLKDETSLIWV